MTTICCAPNPLYTLSVDEAGTISDRHFIGAAFATNEPDLWRERLDQAIDYPHSMHFHKIGRKADGRYRATKTVLDLLRRHNDWYAHFIHIDRTLVDPSRFGFEDQIEFNYWMGQLIKHRTKRPGRCYRVVVAQRERTRGDRYLPELLQQQLDSRSYFDDAPHVDLAIDVPRHDRLLQVADLIGSGTRQLFLPSGNPLKEEIAAEVEDLIRPSGGVIRTYQRIYPWHWRPNAVSKGA
jgi:hypothetical protein